MKKLALLFGALSLVSSVAYAKEVVPVVEEVVVVEEAPVVAPASALKVTSIGQYLEIDNESGKGDGNIGTVHFGNSVGLSYADWTFGVCARKSWSADTHKDADRPVKHIHSVGNRIDLGASKAFANGNLGAKWRMENDADTYYLTGDYAYDMFSGWAELSYKATNAEDANDAWELEAVPAAVTYKDVTLAYYIDATKTINSDEKYSIAHEVRVSAPIWSNEKVGFAAEYRYRFRENTEFKGEEGAWDENNKHVVVLSADYQVNDALSLSSYYQYDFNKYEGHNKEAKDDDYYGEFMIGWNYAF